MTIFGPLKTTRVVRDALTGALQAWMGEYLAEVERQHGREPGQLAVPRSWIVADEYERLPGDQLPSVQVLVARGEDPEQDGDGAISVWFQVGAAVTVHAPTRAEAVDLSELYTAAVRGVLTQRPLAGISARRYRGEDYSDASDRQSTLAAGQVFMSVLVEDVVNAGMGPAPDAEPRPDPAPSYEPWPQASVATVDVEVRT